LKILDIGCGKNKYVPKSEDDEVIGIDIVKLPSVDIVHNLEKFPWSIKSNEFDLIICTHILEHLGDIIKVMEELWRVSKPEAIIKIVVPYHSSVGANTDPTHKINFAYRSFYYFCKEEYDFDFYVKDKFKLIKNKLIFHRTLKIFEGFFNRFPFFYERFFRYILPVEELHTELKKETGTLNNSKR